MAGAIIVLKGRMKGCATTDRGMDSLDVPSSLAFNCKVF